MSDFQFTQSHIIDAIMDKLNKIMVTLDRLERTRPLPDAIGKPFPQPGTVGPEWPRGCPRCGKATPHGSHEVCRGYRL